MATTKFFNLSNLPTVEASSAGNPVYEWNYLDETGALKHDKKDVYAEIQSNRIKTDYKRKIKEGTLENDGPGLYMDTTKFDGTYAGVDNYLASLADAIRAQTVQPQDNGAGAPSGNAENTKASGETAKPVDEIKPTTEGGDGK